MKKIIILCITILTCFTSSVFAETAENTVAKAWQLYRQTNAEIEKVEITINYEGGRKDHKALTRYQQYAASGQDKIAIKFSEPAADKGLGLLIIRKASNDDQWLKLPSVGSVRKVSMSDNSKYFGGTDLTYEDVKMLSSEKTSDYDYKFISPSVISATPRNNIDTSYGKRIIMFTPSLAVSRIEYYDKTDHLIKVLSNDKITTSGDGMWRPQKTVIENKRLKRSTAMSIIERKVNQKLPAQTFTQDFIER